MLLGRYHGSMGTELISHLQPTLNEWEEHLQRCFAAGPLSHETPRSFLRPQRSFRYPPFPTLALESNSQRWTEFAALALGRERELAHLRVFADLETTLYDWLEIHVPPGSPIALPRPCPPEFLRVAQRRHHPVLFLPRDPEAFQGEEFRTCQAFLLSQPNRLDGFYYPEELYGQLLRKFLEASPSAHILSEQSTSLFSANIVVPGRARAAAHPRVQVASSVFPAYCPHGPELSWWAGVSRNSLPSPSFFIGSEVRAEDLAQSLAALQGLSVRQGAAFGEFQRKILLLHHSLRSFGDVLRPLTQAGWLNITVWPESGFYLALKATEWMQHEGFKTATALCEHWAQHLGVFLLPGDFTGLPGHVHLSYASPPKPLEALAQTLVKSLPKTFLDKAQFRGL